MPYLMLTKRHDVIIGGAPHTYQPWSGFEVISFDYQNQAYTVAIAKDNQGRTVRLPWAHLAPFPSKVALTKACGKRDIGDSFDIRDPHTSNNGSITVFCPLERTELVLPTESLEPIKRHAHDVNACAV